MAGTKAVYIAFLLFMLAFNALIFIVPYLASQGSAAAGALYAAFSPTCHQLTSRSECLFISKQSGSMYIGDCMESDLLSYTRTTIVDYGDRIGYKLPVCARDVGIYLSMLLGLLLLPFLQRIESDEWPNKWILVAACIPIGIDGTTQLFGLRESSNTLRIITGVIVGIVLPFFILPILNSVYYSVKEKLASMGKGKPKQEKSRKK